MVRLDPEDVDARLSLGSALTAAGQCAQAVPELEQAVRLAPQWPVPLSRLAWALATCPDYSPDAFDRAVALARQAAELTAYADPHVLDTLAMALAASGKETEARLTWERALELAQRSGDARFASELQRKLSRR